MKPSANFKYPHQKRYYPISQHYAEKFGTKVYKVSVSIADTCPNREGQNGMRTCIFCDEWGSAAYHQQRNLSLQEQIHFHQKAIRKRYKAQKFLVYFQSYTNTFGKYQQFHQLYRQALQEEDVVGLVIGTRPDCLPKRVLNLFEELASQTYLSIELGVQTFDDQQLNFLSRGHSAECSLNAIQKLKRIENVELCVHLMFGLPGETDTQICQTAQLLSELRVDSVKLHNLHVLKNTPLEQMYCDGKFIPVELEEYARKVSLFLEHLSPDIVIHRLVAVASRWEELVSPSWTKEKMRPVQFIEQYLQRSNTWQGKLSIANEHSCLA